MDLLAKTRAVDILRVVTDLGYELQQHRKMICPFHEEKTPSLVLYPQTNTYHCFGCGRHGDVIHFYAGVSNQDYTAAMHELAFNYVADYEPAYRFGTSGKSLRKIQSAGPAATKATVPADTKTYVYKPIHSLIYEDFQRVCEQQPTNAVSEEAEAYLAKRGFEEMTLRKFRIFIVRDYDTVQAYLRNTYSLADLQECGLFNDRGNLIFYRHPILIPYYRRNRIVYLQGRVIGSPSDQVARYQFLSGVPVELFNADVLDVLKPGRVVYLTEGAFDCMSLMQEGLPAVSLGSVTLFKREWAKLFRRFEVCFYFDNDKAGQKAVRDFSELFADFRISTHSKVVREGFKDVNEYLTRRRAEE